jgi:hypothetical protein
MKHGFCPARKMTPEYRAWADMKSRCLNPSIKNYPYYGGRGISICKQWIDSFTSFLSDVGFRPSDLHSLDRIDNNGNYQPGNVRWATAKQQTENRRPERRARRNSKTSELYISIHPGTGKYQLTIRGKYCGLFSTIKSAKRARKERQSFLTV